MKLKAQTTIEKAAFVAEPFQPPIVDQPVKWEESGFKVIDWEWDSNAGCPQW